MPPKHPNKEDITADDYRTAAKVAREYDMLGSAGKFERLASELEGAVESADLVTELAKVHWEALSGRTFFEWDDFSEEAAKVGIDAMTAALAHLTAAGRLVPAGGMPLTAERLAELIADAPAANYEEDDYNAGYVAALIDLRDSLFPATEPAEEVEEWSDIKDVPVGLIVKGRAMIWKWDGTHPYRRNGGSWTRESCDYANRWWPFTPAPAVPAEEETQAERPCGKRSPHEDICTQPTGHAGVHTWAWPDKKPASSPVVPATTGIRERCHDCSCHINPPCGRCVECKHVDYPDCENDCQDCEDHQETPAQAPAHKTTCTDELVRGHGGTVARCTCGWRDAWGVRDGSAEASAHAHSKTHATKESDA
jgi:hypothetical protein